MFNRIKRILVPILCLATFLCLIVAWSQQESANFKILRSVLDGGGKRGISTTFLLEDSIAQPSAIGLSIGSNLMLNAGYQQAEDISLNIQNVEVSPRNFNPYLGEITTLSYILSTNAKEVTITVDGITLVNAQFQSGGLHTVQWDGTDTTGVVAPGNYRFEITAVGYQGEIRNAQRIVMVKDDIPVISNVSDSPDPFYPAVDMVTMINYTTYSSTTTLDVTIDLEDATGIGVTDVTFDDQAKGSYSINWDGTDTGNFGVGGNPLPDGLYVYHINAKTNPPPKRANEKTGTIVLLRSNTETKTSDDGNVILYYQPGFTIDITKATPGQLIDAATAIITSQPSILVQSQIYYITSTPSATFTPPAILIFKYDPSITGDIAQKLQIRTYNPATGQWEVVPNQFVDIANNQIVAEIENLSLFAIFTGEDTTPPVITIISPQAIEYYNTSTIDIIYEVEDPVIDGMSSGVVEEIVYLNGEEYGHETIDLYDLVSENILTVEAYDGAGNIGRASVIFTVILEALVRLEPEALNVNPGILTSFVEFPEGYEVKDIIDATCDGATYERIMLNDDGTVMIIKFRRMDIEEALERRGESIDTNFIVRGRFKEEDETYIFEGRDTISKILEEGGPRVGKGKR